MKTAVALKPESAHFYTLGAEPFYEIENKSRPGEMRAPTVRDARKYFLVPSSNTILGTGAPKKGLRVYQDSQLVLAALTTPRPKEMSDQEFINLIVEWAGEHSSLAAEFGTGFHNAVDAWFKGEVFPDKYCTTIAGFVDWYTSQVLKVLHVEKSFVSLKWGYGGRVDYVGSDGEDFYIIDWKTQEFKLNVKTGKRKAVFYPEWATVLASYAVGMIEWDKLDTTLEKIKLQSVAVDRTTGEVQTKIWEDNERWFEEFLNCFAIYKGRLGKNFDPVCEVVNKKC